MFPDKDSSPATVLVVASELPVIFLTIKDDMATRAAGIALGVSEFVPKPFNKWDLLTRVPHRSSPASGRKR